MNQCLQSRLSAPLIAILLVTLGAGCAATHRNATREELSSLKKGEGVVVGSFDIVVDYQAEQETGNHSWVRADARRTIYELQVSRRGPGGEHLATHAQKVRATPWEPVAFVKKLPAGEYRVRGVDIYDGTLDSLGRKLMRAPLDFRFTVEAGVMNYVGRMTMFLPPRLVGSHTRVRHGVADTEAQDFVALGWELGEVPLVYVKRLAVSKRLGFRFGALGRR